jgi:hypothetical protein
MKGLLLYLRCEGIYVPIDSRKSYRRLINFSSAVAMLARSFLRSIDPKGGNPPPFRLGFLAADTGTLLLVAAPNKTLDVSTVECTLQG